VHKLSYRISYGLNISSGIFSLIFAYLIQIINEINFALKEFNCILILLVHKFGFCLSFFLF